jgi:hypothetical protein
MNHKHGNSMFVLRSSDDVPTPMYRRPASSDAWLLGNMLRDPIVAHFLRSHPTKVRLLSTTEVMDNVLDFNGPLERLRLAQVSKLFQAAINLDCQRKFNALKASPFVQQNDDWSTQINNWLENHKEEFELSTGIIALSHRWWLSQLMACPLETFDAQLQVAGSSVFVEFESFMDDDDDDDDQVTVGGAVWNVGRERGNECVFSLMADRCRHPFEEWRPCFEDGDGNSLALLHYQKGRVVPFLTRFLRSARSYIMLQRVHLTAYREYYGLSNRSFAFLPVTGADGSQRMKNCHWKGSVFFEIGTMTMGANEPDHEIQIEGFSQSTGSHIGFDNATMAVCNGKWLLVNYVLATYDKIARDSNASRQFRSVTWKRIKSFRGSKAT